MTYTGGASGVVLTLPTEVSARSYGDVYGTGFYWALGLGYRVTENGEVRISGNYTSNPAERLQVGTVASLPLFGEFGDYKAFGMDFGYRQYLTRSRVQPFVGANVGFTRVDAIDGTFSVPAASVTIPDVSFYASRREPSLGDADHRRDHVPVLGGTTAPQSRRRMAGAPASDAKPRAPAQASSLSTSQGASPAGTRYGWTIV